MKHLNADGRTVIERVYTGRWYEPMLSRERQITLRILYVLLFVCGAGLFVFTATRRTRCNATLYVGLLQALAVVLGIWCIYVFVFYIPARGKLTIGEYDSLHKPLIRASGACALCQAALAAASTVCFFLHLDQKDPADLVCALGFLGCTVLFGLIWFLESHLEYAVLDNSTVPPEEGVEIDA